ncbi:MAG: hypothetical protein ACPKQO_02060, partial [Nitrososphaeraceae archaeon]
MNQKFLATIKMISISIIILFNILISTHYFFINNANAIEDRQTKQNISDLQIISKLKMTMPGTNMTFGVPLENAKMHLI